MNKKFELLRQAVNTYKVNHCDGDKNEKELLKFIDELEQLTIPAVISRLRDIPRFNLTTYRIGDFETETEREHDEQGDYIDAYEIEALIRELKNGL